MLELFLTVLFLTVAIHLELYNCMKNICFQQLHFSLVFYMCTAADCTSLERHGKIKHVASCDLC